MGKEIQENDEMQIDLVELFYALKKRILIILLAMIIGGGLGIAYTKMVVTPIYSSTSSMFIITGESTFTSLTDIELGSSLTQDYSELITSRTVMRMVIDELDLNMSYSALQSNISIENPTDTHILEITVKDTDPERAKELVDTVAEVSSEYIADQMEVTAPKIIEKGVLPTSPINVSVRRTALLGALIGIALSAGIIILLTIMDDTIKTEGDVERYLDLPVLASVPDRKDNLSKNKKGKKKSGKRRKK